MGDLNINFKDSIKDLVWLLDRGYPKRSAIELVGNRYRLNHEERLILYRGVFDTESIEGRKKKRMEPLGEKLDGVIIDGYNVFITLESYLYGRGVFRSLDGYVRDTAGLYGNYTFSPLSERATDLIIAYLKLGIPFYLTLCLDYPVSKSGEFASYLRERFSYERINISIELVNSPDSFIVQEIGRFPHWVTATSDTAVIDRVERVIDIPEYIIVTMMGKEILDLGSLLSE